MFSQLPRPKGRRFRRVAAALMLAFFVQGLTSVFLHLDVHEHYFCAEHARVTHDAEHARATQRRSESDLAQVRSSSHPSNDEHRPSDEERPGDSQCKWMSWLKESTPLVPDAPADPLPSLTADAAPAPLALASQTRRGRPVPIQRDAPTNSPPRG